MAKLDNCCEALSLIQMGLTELGKGVQDSEGKKLVDQIGNAWLTLGTAHGMECVCSDQVEMAENIKAFVADWFGELVPVGKEIT